MIDSIIRFLNEGSSEGFYELEANYELGFFGLMLIIVLCAALLVVLTMALKAWRRQRLTDPRKDHYRR